MRCGCLWSIENHREQVEMLYRGGANTVGKQHFTLLYQRARNLAFTSRNIRSGWAKTGLYPFDPEKVLKSAIPKMMLCRKLLMPPLTYLHKMACSLLLSQLRAW
jgi:hypothetical protein